MSGLVKRSLSRRFGVRERISGVSAVCLIGTDSLGTDRGTFSAFPRMALPPQKVVLLRGDHAFEKNEFGVGDVLRGEVTSPP